MWNSTDKISGPDYSLPRRFLPFPSRRPWVNFSVFLLANSLLSWAPVPWTWRLCLGGLGFVLFFLWALKNPAESGSPPPWGRECLGPVPVPILGLLLFCALVARTVHLTSIPVWPLTDEGANGFFALQLDHQWHWNLFFDYDHLPPLFFWYLALFFKFFPPSLASLWLATLPVTLLTLILGYFACRCFFSKSLSLLWACLWAFSFWPLYIGKFSVPPVLIPLWECGCLLLLGLWVRALPGRPHPAIPLGLGLALGSGFYVFFNWPLVAFLFLAALIFPGVSPLGPPARRMGTFLAVLLPAVILSIPLVAGHFSLSPGFQYFKGLWAFHPDFQAGGYLKMTASYVTSLFWGPDPSIESFSYKPLWGGFLNPLLDSLFFMGLLELARYRNHSCSRWAATAFALFLLPVLFTNNLEMFRIVEILPVVLFVVSLGIQEVLQPIKKGKRLWVLAALGFLSLLLDGYHLGVFYPRFWATHPGKWAAYAKQVSCYEAYQILSQRGEKQGPGLVLNEFTARLEKDPEEQVLTLACFPFDAGRNPKLGIEKARWVALFVQDQDLGFLRQRFPRAVWTDLGPGPHFDEPNRRYFLAVFEMDSTNRSFWFPWARANLFLQEIVYESLNPLSSGFRTEIDRSMLQNYGLFRGDPFLESHFWTLVAGNRESDGRMEETWEALRTGIERGYLYPTPLKYYLMGFRLFQKGNYVSAREAYLTAAGLDPRFTPPPAALRRLDELAKGEKRAGASGVPNPGLGP